MANVRVPQEEINDMLFWYVVFDGNCYKVAKKIRELYKNKRSRKVVRDIATRERFDLKKHIVRDKVNEYLYGSTDVGLSRAVELALDLMEIDEAIMKDAKSFAQSKGKKPTMFKNAGEMLAAVKQVTDDLKNLGNIKDPKAAAYQQVHQSQAPILDVSFRDLLEQLPEEEAENLKKSIATREREKILEIKFGNSG